MHDATSETEIDDQVQAPDIKPSRRFSIVWLVPALALIVGASIAIQTIRETGPTIVIEFKSAEGLVPGKTEIKYKDVTVGKVQQIRISEDLTKVLVTAAMSREMAGHLNEDSLFWIVRAHVAIGQVSGLSTLLSGAYIEMAPGSGGKIAARFKGREKPPAVSRGTPGQQFRLLSEDLGSLDIGSPVYFRQVRVGRVTNVSMSSDVSGVKLDVFINAPHHHQVRRSSRFYNVSGLDLSIGSNGVRIDTPSLVSLIVGGISFFTIEETKDDPPVERNHVFTLYDNLDAAHAASYSYREYYLLYFDETVRGLAAGANVEFYGIKIGEVIDVSLQFDQDNLVFRIPVLIAIEPDRIEFTSDLSIPEYKVMDKLVEKGLRAQQRVGNLLTGQSYIGMAIYPDAEAQKLGMDDIHPILPTIPNAMAEITTTARRMVERINKLPLEETLADIRVAARQVEAMTGSETMESAIDNIDKSFEEFLKVNTDLNAGTLQRINDMLDQANDSLARGGQALDGFSRVMDESEPVVYNLNRLLLDLQESARAVEALADYLERHPEAIIFGKGEGQ
jgi:paraquat-inducible protein B